MGTNDGLLQFEYDVDDIRREDLVTPPITRASAENGDTVHSDNVSLEGAADDGKVRFDAQFKSKNAAHKRKNIRIEDIIENEAQVAEVKRVRLLQERREAQEEIIELSSDGDDECVVDGEKPSTSRDTKSTWKPWQKEREERLRQLETKRSSQSRKTHRSKGYTDDWLNYTYTDEGGIVLNAECSDSTAAFIHPMLSNQLKPHQISGVKFLFDNMIVSLDDYTKQEGYGCVLAHSMGLGKTLQVITFVDVLFRHTAARHMLVVVPKNVIANWQREFDKWLPQNPTLLSSNSRQFQVHVLDDNARTPQQRMDVIGQWRRTRKGILLVNYEMLRRLIATAKNSKAESGAINTINLEPSDDEIAGDVYKALIDPGADVIVCDEGHKIKEEKTKITETLKAVRTKRRLVLTGYPLQNNLAEYYCMIDFVRPGFLGTRRQFRNMFEAPILNGMCLDSTEEDVKLARYRTAVLIDSLKSFVMRRSHALLRAMVPTNTELVLLIRKSEAQQRIYRAFINHVAASYGNCGPSTPVNVLEAYAVGVKIWNHPDVLHSFLGDGATRADLLDEDVVVEDANFNTRARMRPSASAPQINARNNHALIDESLDWARSAFNGYQRDIVENGSKMQVALSLIEQCVRHGQKALLYSQSLRTLDVIERLLSLEHNMIDDKGQRIVWRNGVSYYRMQGSTRSKERDTMINGFNNDADKHLFLISTRAGSLGINLVAATRVIIMDASWNPCHDAQAVCRVYRYGQTERTYIYRLVADNCMERVIFNRQVTKSNMFRKVVDDRNSQVQLSKTEIEHLLKYDAELDNPPEPALVADDLKCTEDVVLRATFQQLTHLFAKEPFLHEELMMETDSELTPAERNEANMLFMKELQDYRRSGEWENRNAKLRQDYLQKNLPVNQRRPSLPPMWQNRYNVPSIRHSASAHHMTHTSSSSTSPNSHSYIDAARYLNRVSPRYIAQPNIKAAGRSEFITESIVTSWPCTLTDARTGELVHVPANVNAFLIRSNAQSQSTYLRLRGNDCLLNASKTPYEQLLNERLANMKRAPMAPPRPPPPRQTNMNPVMIELD